MACGRAVYVYDIFGGDGWVTTETYEALEADHFAGQATGRVIDAAQLEDDLGGYRQAMGVANRDLVLQHHRSRAHAIARLEAFSAPAIERPPAPLQELSRLVALQWSWERLAREAQGGHADAHNRLVLAEATADANAAAASTATALQTELDAIRASRTWRLTGGYRRWRGLLSRRANGRSA
jgi:hypothetical protein